jgi:hypothetical protein
MRAFNILPESPKVDQKTVRRIRLNLDLFGDLYAPNCVHAKLGCPPSLNKEQEDFILFYLQDQPRTYLDELQQVVSGCREAVLC